MVFQKGEAKKSPLRVQKCNQSLAHICPSCGAFVCVTLPRRGQYPQGTLKFIKNNRRCRCKKEIPSLVSIGINFKSGKASPDILYKARECSLSPCPHDLVRRLGFRVLLWGCGLASEGRPLGHFSAGAGCLLALDTSLGAAGL